MDTVFLPSHLQWKATSFYTYVLHILLPSHLQWKATKYIPMCYISYYHHTYNGRQPSIYLCVTYLITITLTMEGNQVYTYVLHILLPSHLQWKATKYIPMCYISYYHHTYNGRQPSIYLCVTYLITITLTMEGNQVYTYVLHILLPSHLQWKATKYIPMCYISYYHHTYNGRQPSIYLCVTYLITITLTMEGNQVYTYVLHILLPSHLQWKATKYIPMCYISYYHHTYNGRQPSIYLCVTYLITITLTMEGNQVYTYVLHILLPSHLQWKATKYIPMCYISYYHHTYNGRQPSIYLCVTYLITITLTMEGNQVYTYVLHILLPSHLQWKATKYIPMCYISYYHHLQWKATKYIPMCYISYYHHAHNGRQPSIYLCATYLITITLTMEGNLVYTYVLHILLPSHLQWKATYLTKYIPMCYISYYHHAHNGRQPSIYLCATYLITITLTMEGNQVYTYVLHILLPSHLQWKATKYIPMCYISYYHHTYNGRQPSIYLCATYLITITLTMEGNQVYTYVLHILLPSHLQWKATKYIPMCYISYYHHTYNGRQPSIYLCVTYLITITLTMEGNQVYTYVLHILLPSHSQWKATKYIPMCYISYYHHTYNGRQPSIYLCVTYLITITLTMEGNQVYTYICVTYLITITLTMEGNQVYTYVLHILLPSHLQWKATKYIPMCYISYYHHTYNGRQPSIYLHMCYISYYHHTYNGRQPSIYLCVTYLITITLTMEGNQVYTYVLHILLPSHLQWKATKYIPMCYISYYHHTYNGRQPSILYLFTYLTHEKR